MLDVSGAEKIFEEMLNSGIMNDSETISSESFFNTMIDLYGKIENFHKMEKLSETMDSLGIEKSAVTYNSFLEVYGKQLKVERAENMYREMLKKGKLSFLLALIFCRNKTRCHHIQHITQDICKSRKDGRSIANIGGDDELGLSSRQRKQGFSRSRMRKNGISQKGNNAIPTKQKKE